MGQLYDTHYHLDLQKDHAAAIREIENNQIYTIAVTNLPDLYRKETAEINSKYIRIALGFHPELIHKYQKQIPLMWELLPKAKYIGEVGLDFVDKTHQREQIEFFSELIERCRYDSSKIITIHSRKAVRNVLDIIGNNFGFLPILHWFTGSKEELIEAVNKGCYISVNGSMIRSKRFQSILPFIPHERLLLETDSPFTYSQVTYSNTLSVIKSTLETSVACVDLWDNFRCILTKHQKI